jgi:uncharacterized membrane protein
MKLRTTMILLVLLAAASFALSLWAMPNLPEQIPAHWNAVGVVDRYAPRSTALWQMPLIILGTGLLLLFLPMIDPLRKNVDQFRPAFHWLILGTAAFLTYLHGLTLLAGLGLPINMSYWMIPAFAALMIGIGFLTERALPNWFIGIRTPWTLSSPTVWQKTHRLGGLTFKIAGLLCLLALLFPPEIGLMLALIPILAASIIPVIYSYLLFRAEHQG